MASNLMIQKISDVTSVTINESRLMESRELDALAAELYQLVEKMDRKKLIVKGEDTLVKRPITIPFDLVVHAIGMDPNVDNKSLATTFGVALEQHGNIAKGSAYGALGESSRAGVFVAGAAAGPETIDDSIAQAKAAALAAFAFANQAPAEVAAA